MSASELTPEEKKHLLQIARQTISKHLKKDRVEQERPDTEALAAPCGAFVTLHRRGMLRGCIGTFVSSRPLLDTVQEMAISASTKDPRFAPMSADELGEVDLEISVLSPLRQIKDPNDIEVGRHGIFITRGFYSGVLLPQVATEQGWDTDTFLQQTCVKAGLPTDAWKDPATKIEVFEAQVFGENDTD